MLVLLVVTSRPFRGANRLLLQFVHEEKALLLHRCHRRRRLLPWTRGDGSATVRSGSLMERSHQNILLPHSSFQVLDLVSALGGVVCSIEVATMLLRLSRLPNLHFFLILFYIISALSITFLPSRFD